MTSVDGLPTPWMSRTEIVQVLGQGASPRTMTTLYASVIVTNGVNTLAIFSTMQTKIINNYTVQFII